VPKLCPAVSRIAQVLVAGDVAALEDLGRGVAADLHADGLRRPRPHHRPHRAASQVVQEHAGIPGSTGAGAPCLPEFAPALALQRAAVGVDEDVGDHPPELALECVHLGALGRQQAHGGGREVHDAALAVLGMGAVEPEAPLGEIDAAPRQRQHFALAAPRRLEGDRGRQGQPGLEWFVDEWVRQGGSRGEAVLQIQGYPFR